MLVHVQRQDIEDSRRLWQYQGWARAGPTTARACTRAVEIETCTCTDVQIEVKHTLSLILTDFTARACAWHACRRAARRTCPPLGNTKSNGSPTPRPLFFLRLRLLSCSPPPTRGRLSRIRISDTATDGQATNHGPAATAAVHGSWRRRRRRRRGDGGRRPPAADPRRRGEPREQ